MDFRNNLLKNSFDFLNRSIDVLEDHPKYSIIFFATSLELFVKARLAQEHWTLVIENPNSTNINQVQSGDFFSVSLSNGMDRIENILNESFTKNQKDLFESISEHRNQIIHFYNEDYTDDSDDEMVQKALRDLSEGWYYLSILLNKKWASISSDYGSEIQEIEDKLSSKGHLLQGKFVSLQRKGVFKEKDGIEINTCKICHFESAISTTLVEDLIRCNCPVCESKYDTIKFECPDCSETIFTEEFGEGVCQNCEFEIELNDIINEYEPYFNPSDPDNRSIYCTTCECYKGSVFQMGSEYVCVNCFERYQDYTQCDYCGELNSGHLEHTYLSGCSMCEGKFAHIKDE